MNLFDECKEALGADFEVLEGQREKDALNILYKFPFINGNLLWDDFNYSDYEDINHLISDCYNKNMMCLFLWITLTFLFLELT